MLSQSVANSLKMKEDPELSSTIEFIEKVNRAFDILNVRYKGEGSRTRNPAKEPYTDINDDRFKVKYMRFIIKLSHTIRCDIR